MIDNSGMSMETRGRDEARKVKIFSAIAMIAGVIFFAIAGAVGKDIGDLFTLFGGVSLAGGFIGFIIGRFME